MSTTRREPAELAAAVERGLAVPDGPGDRFAGYSVLGLPFADGDVLALRRFPASSIGVGYTSVWHREPGGAWTFYSDVPAAYGCTRYFSPAVAQTVVAPIRLEWTGPRHLEVAVDGGRLLSWSMDVAATPTTAVLNALASRMSPAWRTSPRVLAFVAALARVLLGAGRVRLTGRTPSGRRFLAMPQTMWTVSRSRASVAGRDLGRPAPLARQAALGEFWIPQRGLFAFGQAFMVDDAARSASSPQFAPVRR